MAPYLGVSLYTWTSIIGVMLGGISLGNFLGGKIADRHYGRDILGFAFLASGLSTLSIIFFVRYFGSSLSNGFLSLPLATFVFSLFIFFTPAMMLSFITPIMIKVTLKDLNQTGNVVGRMYAFSTLGSILGTFTTGYYLIAWFGTKIIVMSISLILIVIGTYISLDFVRIFKKKFFLLIIMVTALSFIVEDKCFWESNYYCIKLLPYEDNGVKKGLALQLDHLIHAYVAKDDPRDLGYKYEKAYALLSQYVGGGDKSYLFLGGGGYVLPRYLERSNLSADIEVVEIDPKVTQVNYSNLWLSPTTSIVTYNMDARIFFENTKKKKLYDIIYTDVFNDISVPYHLTTREFNEKIKKYLKSNGIFAPMLIDDVRIGRFLASYVYTLSHTFQNIYISPLAKDWKKLRGRNTYVIFASNIPLDPVRWSQAQDALVQSGIIKEDEKEAVGNLIYDRDLEDILKRANKVVLTDDYAPVDNMLAIVFKYRYIKN